MLEIIRILFAVCCVVAQTLETQKPVLLKLTPEQIRDTFDNVMSDDYIKVLAKDFASKAAQHFMKEMNNQKSVLANKLSAQMYRVTSRPPPVVKRPERTQPEVQVEYKPVELETEKPREATVEVQNQPQLQAQDLLNSQEALRLLKDPSPDGDHLDSQSGELSGENSRDSIPVIEVMKINGNYFRRLLGLL